MIFATISPPFSADTSKPRSLRLNAPAELRRPVSQTTTYCSLGDVATWRYEK